VLYELREYESVPSRMPALVARFRDHTLRLFAEHGFDVAFIGLTEFGENSNNQLTYALRFTSYAEMEQRWAEFMRNPEWLRVRKDSERDGPLVARVHRRLINTATFDDAGRA